MAVMLISVKNTTYIIVYQKNLKVHHLHISTVSSPASFFGVSMPTVNSSSRQSKDPLNTHPLNLSIL